MKLDSDIENGLYFESTIPESYGLGSSGAVVAAIYESYKQEVGVDLEINDLKLILSNIESFFHGQSSGIDPLSCYVQKPLLVESKNSINTIDIPPQNINSKRTLFLLDTECKGNTQGLVEIFLNKLRRKDFEVFLKMSLWLPQIIQLQIFWNVNMKILKITLLNFRKKHLIIFKR